MTSTNLAETIDVLVRRHGVGIDRLREVVEGLLGGPLRMISVTAEHGWRAGTLRATHYQRRSQPLSLADCVLLACAGPSDAVASSDRGVLETAAIEGIETIALPRSGPRAA